MPDIEIPMAIVFTTYQAGPEEIENLVTKPIESACASVSGMEEIASSSSENVSMVMVSFADGTNLDEATVSLREKVDMIKSTLPEDASAPTIMKLDPDAMPVTVFSLNGNDLSSLQQLAEDTVSPALERINGVASVSISGGYENEIAIETYSNRLAGYNLTVPYIAQILAAENITIPAGEVDIATQITKSQIYAEELLRDDDGFTTRRYVQSTAIAKARSYNAAYNTAVQNAKADIAASLQTEIIAAMQSEIDNEAVSATGVEKFNMKASAITNSTLTNTISSIVIYRRLEDKVIEFQVRIVFDKMELVARLKREMLKQLELNSDDVEDIVDTAVRNL
jgi:Cu/Ag efflux pump CusA